MGYKTAEKMISSKVEFILDLFFKRVIDVCI